MAKIKFGLTIVDGRGKLNGNVLAKNRAGNYMRTKVTPTNPRTPAQVAQRAKLSSYAQEWRGLTEEQRLAWSGAVENYGSTNIFGDIVKPSGNTLYSKINMNIQTAGGTKVLLPPLPTGVTTPTTISASADSVTGHINVDFGPSPVPANMSLKIEATAQMSAGISNANNRFRVIDVKATGSASPYDASVTYADRFGGLVAGQKIFFRISFINKLTGEMSQALNQSVIVS
jgi:hypothetical protein